MLFRSRPQYEGSFEEVPKAHVPSDAKATEKAKEDAAAYARAKTKFDAGMAMWPAEVAALRGCCRATVSTWVNRHEYPLGKIGNKILPRHLVSWEDEEAARQAAAGRRKGV